MCLSQLRVLHFRSKFPPLRSQFSLSKYKNESPFSALSLSYHQSDPLRVSMLGGCLHSLSSLICSIIFSPSSSSDHHYGHLCLVTLPGPAVPFSMDTAPLLHAPGHHNHRVDVSSRFKEKIRAQKRKQLTTDY